MFTKNSFTSFIIKNMTCSKFILIRCVVGSTKRTWGHSEITNLCFANQAFFVQRVDVIMWKKYNRPYFGYFSTLIKCSDCAYMLGASSIQCLEQIPNNTRDIICRREGFSRKVLSEKSSR